MLIIKQLVYLQITPLKSIVMPHDAQGMRQTVHDKKVKAEFAVGLS